MSRLPSRSLRVRLTAAAIVLTVSGCAREGEEPAAAAPKAVRCVAPAALPGSLPLAERLRSSISSVDVPLPASAVGFARKACNRLALEPGLFARAHALDAIDWRPWSPAAFDEARALGRPVFAMSGYSACAACRELSNGALQRRRLVRDLNRYFIPVLVDREERPDVDAYLMLGAQVLTGGGGWPAVFFLTDDARPFDARSWGAAGTGDRTPAKVVEDVRRRIELGGGSIAERAESTAEKMERRAVLDTKGPLPDAGAAETALRGYVAESFDRESGSFGTPPLFPRPPVVDFLLRLGRTKSDAGALEMATIALDRLRTSPLADREAGGFFRFAREAGWREPVREKMLAINAAIASSYFEAAATTGSADFLAAGRATVDFLRRDLALADGSFAASIDATAGATTRRDDRVLADGNALAISALVRASAAVKDAGYLDAAVAAAKVLDGRLRDGGIVNHCLYPDGRRCVDGYLADQAFTALAFLDLDGARAPGEGRWLDAARTIAGALVERFGHEGTGGFFQTRSGADPLLPLRLQPGLDTSVASGNSAAAWLFVRLAARTGDEAYSKVARGTFEAFSEVLMLRPLVLPSMVTALSAASEPPQLEPAPAVQP